MIDGTRDWDEQKWHARTLLECSLAIKCPSIDLHLSTFKKFQQVFTDETILRKASGSEETTETIKHLFKGIWSLEDLCKEGAPVNEVVEDAIQRPHNYVLKPQKEGGGNNFFDDELQQKLQIAKAANGKDPELSTYLIMERINPPMIPAVLLRCGQARQQTTMSEFGFFSIVISRNTDKGRQTLHNRVIGSLMRTKDSHNNEGGVNAGYAVIDRPLVVPSEVFNQAVEGILRI